MLSETALVKMKKVLASCFTSTCDIYEFVEQENEDGSTEYVEKFVDTIACKLSFSTSDVSRDTALASGVNLVATLFVLSDCVVKPGSKFVISQNGIVYNFENSGVPLQYETHQEIKLRLMQEWT